MNHNKTIELLLKTLSASPNDWELRLHLAELYQNQYDQAKALSLLLEAPHLPDSSEMGIQAANAIAALDQQAAINFLDQIISADKACAPAYLAKATIYQQQNDKPSARKNYSVATVIDESLEDPHFEAWLDGADKPAPMAISQPYHPEHSEPTPQQPEDDFIETDTALDEALNAVAQVIDFSDIGGMEALKERIRMSIIYPFKNKDLFAKFKKRSGGGLLFYGPPGCGKTLISRATAGECGAHFINISVHDVLSKWIGESEQRIHALFSEARRKSPTIIFIDEVDALGVKRSDAGHTASLVNTLLTEMDGSQSNNDDILVIGATNTPWRVDSAFRRPGRFDHVLFVPPPDIEARHAILEVILKEIPQEKIDLKKLAKLTDKFSGADLKAVVDRATETTIQEIMKTGKEIKLQQKHLTNSIKQSRPTTLEWLEQASNYASYANQSGLYDELSEYIKSR
ncbi:AAA family ATPase [Rubritalea tangerina]|uniref:AAA family ATPase n=1 Tax=Rubritalea tangerina TaxID=430798 RepID=A0ABW4ZF16_9BACT